VLCPTPGSKAGIDGFALRERKPVCKEKLQEYNGTDGRGHPQEMSERKALQEKELWKID